MVTDSMGHDGPMHLTVVDHPLAQAALTVLRDESTEAAGFRAAMNALATMLIYDATRELSTQDITVTTPLTDTAGVRIDAPPYVIPVLRAGLGMLAGALTHLPDAPTAFVGVARNDDTLIPEPYLNSLPGDLDGRDVLVLDPMLATGGSLAHAAELIGDRNPGKVTAVCVLAAPAGVATLRRTGAVDALVLASIDDHLNDDAFIVPGLGDAGDRLYGLA